MFLTTNDHFFTRHISFLIYFVLTLFIHVTKGIQNNPKKMPIVQTAKYMILWLWKINSFPTDMTSMTQSLSPTVMK